MPMPLSMEDKMRQEQWVCDEATMISLLDFVSSPSFLHLKATHDISVNELGSSRLIAKHCFHV